MSDKKKDKTGKGKNRGGKGGERKPAWKGTAAEAGIPENQSTNGQAADAVNDSETEAAAAVQAENIETATVKTEQDQKPAPAAKPVPAVKKDDPDRVVMIEDRVGHVITNFDMTLKLNQDTTRGTVLFKGPGYLNVVVSVKDIVRRASIALQPSCSAERREAITKTLLAELKTRKFELRLVKRRKERPIGGGKTQKYWVRTLELSTPQANVAIPEQDIAIVVGLPLYKQHGEKTGAFVRCTPETRLREFFYDADTESQVVAVTVGDEGLYIETLEREYDKQIGRKVEKVLFTVDIDPTAAGLDKIKTCDHRKTVGAREAKVVAETTTKDREQIAS